MAVNDAPVASDSKLRVFMALDTRIYVGGSDVDGDGPEQPCADDPATSTAAPTSAFPPHRGIGCGKIRNTRVKITQLPTQGELYEVASNGGKGLLLSAGSVMGVGDWGQLDANPSVYYVSNTINSTGVRLVASDSFQFSLTDADDAESTNNGTVFIDVLSGLDAVSLDSTVNEEEPTVFQLRGYNAREEPPAVNISTTFVLEGLPVHGTLYQYDDRAADSKGSPITAAMLPVTVTDEPWNDPVNPLCCNKNGIVATCDGSTGGVYVWLCPRLVYEGDLDWFSWPTQTRNGVALNESDENWSYHVTSATETSASANISVRVRNINDPPIVVLSPKASFAPQSQKNPGLLRSILSVTDADRGVGLYQIKLQLSSMTGTLTETSLKQPADGLYRGTASLQYWQWDTRFIETLLGYCPPVCSGMPGSCLGSSCLMGDGLDMRNWSFFVSPATLPSVLEKIEFFSSSATSLTLSVEINDFDDGVCTASDNAACGSYLSNKATCELSEAPPPSPPPPPLVPQESSQEWYQSFESFADSVGTAACPNGLVTRAHVAGTHDMRHESRD